MVFSKILEMDSSHLIVSVCYDSVYLENLKRLLSESRDNQKLNLSKTIYVSYTLETLNILH